MKIAVIDIEATALTTEGSIVEIGAVELDTEEQTITTLFDSIIREDKFRGEDAWIFINSTLTPQEVFDAPTLESKREQIQKILNEYPVTAFNKKFDFEYLRDRNFKVSNSQKGDIAAGFQEAVVDTLTEKSLLACSLAGTRQFVVGGGVAANRRLRTILTRRLSERGIKVYFPGRQFCQDNAAMVAGLGYQIYKAGRIDNLNLAVEPNLT